MATFLVKAALSVGVVGATGASGFGIWRAFGRSSDAISMKEKILASYKDSFSKFLLDGDVNWASIKDEYGKEGAIDKPVHEGKFIDKEELPSWCGKSIDSPFDERDISRLNAVLRWCYINTNSFSLQATALGKELHGVTNSGDDTVWKDAWENTYKKFKDNPKWQISAESTNLNSSDKEQGGPALKNWCSTKSSLIMFSNEAKDTFPKFEKFCLKNKAN